MRVIDDDLLEGLGFGSLSTKDRSSLIEAAGDELAGRVAHRVMALLSNELQAEFRALTGEAEMLAWMDEHVPEAEEISLEEFDALCEELRAGAMVVCAELAPSPTAHRCVGLQFTEAVPHDKRADVLRLLVRVFSIADRNRAMEAIRHAPGSVIEGVPEPAARAVRHPLLQDVGVEVQIVTSVPKADGGRATPTYAIVDIDVHGERPVDPTDDRPSDQRAFVFLEGTATDDVGVRYTWELITRANFVGLIRERQGDGSVGHDYTHLEVGPIEIGGRRGQVEIVPMAGGFDWSRVILEVESFPHGIIDELAPTPLAARELIFRPFAPATESSL